MDMIRFGNEHMLYGFILVPVLVLLYLAAHYRRRRRLNLLVESSLHHRLWPMASSGRRVWKFILTFTAFCFIVIAMADPQVGSKLEQADQKGIDMVIAFDVSRSMLAQDLQPDRLENAKRAVLRLTNRLEGDRLGLVVFAGKAYKQLPLTNDYAIAKMFIRNLSTQTVPTQGTAIGEALRKAIDSFDQQANNNQTIIIISDGENHEKDPLPLAREAAEKGIIVHTIGMGSPQGAPIPISNQPGTGRYLKDNDGNTVISQLDQQMLESIANEGNGKFILANNIRSGVNAIYDELKKLEAGKYESRTFSEYESQFRYPLTIAIVLLIIEQLLFYKKPNGKSLIKWIANATKT